MTTQLPWHKIKCLILDIDGICTDGSLTYGPLGEVCKKFHVLDGHGIKLLLQASLNVAIISGRNSPMVTQRFSELGVKYIYQGQADKLPAYNEILAKLNLKTNQIAYMGDDLPDIPLLKKAGIGISVPAGHTSAKSSADFICKNGGGFGAVREVCDKIIKSIS